MFIPTGEINIEFNPSQTSVKLPNGRTIRAKGFPCAGTLTDRSYLVSASPLSGFQRIDQTRNCFFLFFDAAPPGVDEVFVLRINGVGRFGRTIDIPEIIFREGRG